MQEKGRSQNLIQKLAVLYLIVWTISPPLEIDMVYRILALGCVGLWLIAASVRTFLIEEIHIYAALFAFAAMVIAYLEKGSLDAILQQIPIYILVICFFINCFYKEGRWHELSGIVLVILILLSVFNWNTAQILLEDPTIARRLVRADESVYEYLRQGIGGYSLIYPQVCIFPAILAWITKAFRKSKVCFVIGCIWLYTYISFIINAGYSIAIFASIVGAIMLFFYRGKNIWAAFFVAAIIFISVLAAIFYLDGFRTFLLEFFDGTAVVTKINDMMSSTESGAAEGSIYARMIRYRASIEVIFEYPLIGGLWMKNGGGHSAILDHFAKYGIWGGVIFAKMIFYVPNDYKHRYKTSSIRVISNAVIVSLLFVAFLDAFTYSFMAMILLVLPLLYEDIIRWEDID